MAENLGEPNQVPRGCCEQHFVPRAIRGWCYCVRNLYATIRATVLATQLNLLKVGAESEIR